MANSQEFFKPFLGILLFLLKNEQKILEISGIQLVSFYFEKKAKYNIIYESQFTDKKVGKEEISKVFNAFFSTLELYDPKHNKFFQDFRIVGDHVSIGYLLHKGELEQKVFKSFDNRSKNFKRNEIENQTQLGGNLFTIKDDYKILVYDYIDGTHLPKKIDHLIQIINQLADLHKQGKNHGDIRLYNLIFGEKCLIIDYDYVGLKKYPSGYNCVWDTVRHQSAKGDAEIKKEHDWFSLGEIAKMFNPIDQNLKNEWLSLCEESKISPTQLMNPII